MSFPTEPDVERIVEQFLRELARFEAAAACVESHLRRELRGTTIRHLLLSRAKHPDDLREKIRKKVGVKDERYQMKALAASLEKTVTDLAGCRVVVYRPADEAEVAKVVKKLFTLAEVPSAEQIHDKLSGYRATHLLVGLGPTEELAVRGTICEVQICTLAAHLFNELEHDILYKIRGVSPSLEEKQYLAELLQSVRLADGSAQRVFNARAENSVHQTSPLEGPAELKFVMEQNAGTPLRGNFGRLFKMLDVMFDPLTASTITEELDLKASLDRGAAETLRLDLDTDDDVVRFVLGIFPQYAEEMTEMAAHWRGKTPLATAIHAAAADRKKGGS